MWWHDSDKTLVSGHGNFGNLLCYKNIEKPIISYDIMSPEHMMNTTISECMIYLEILLLIQVYPTWRNLFKLIYGALKRKL
ncbi:hypothetical protein ACH24_04485 [Francisella persica ATCC VR-331]|uniref:Uncharacterized protein n=1 Tax=Francisella persica ATCC VR-331 TaxID=1086726 RepID=A0AAC8ZMX7_9GAMM|nr:hypothetical protein [Francisella persica]ALB01905.1 hypothetical protein ACH24_04485 [Francisella persica ATCC VR-331]ANH77159.1 hypothetical protein FSC845_00600 [Francisella persica ATCC VR-331]